LHSNEFSDFVVIYFSPIDFPIYVDHCQMVLPIILPLNFP
jgi:hypothetical protein